MRRGLALLGLACVLSLGSRCGGPTGPSAAAIVLPVTATIQQNDIFEVTVSVSVQGATLQAFELALQADPAQLVPIAAAPDPEFDDDGSLFVQPVLEVLDGRVSRVVDLRHGPGAPAGTTNVAVFQVLAWQPGTSELRITGARFVDANGQELPLTTIPAIITVVP